MRRRLPELILVAAAVAGACRGAASTSPPPPRQELPFNPMAEALVIYEVNVSTANACLPDLGDDAQRRACAARPLPPRRRVVDPDRCADSAQLAAIRLGTLDDLRAPYADYHQGVTVRYVAETVGANTLWLMPLFPNNDEWEVSHPCDDLGSPYAARDLMHVAGRYARACVDAGRDEHSDPPCWGDAALDAVIADAHARGLRVFLDVALNHVGHFFTLFDYVDLGDAGLVRPEILDTPAELEALDGVDRELHAALRARCPALDPLQRVRAFGAWRLATEAERAAFPCNAPHLDVALPAFYTGHDGRRPSRGDGDFFWQSWRDVKVLYHVDDEPAHAAEFERVRAYLFRVLNYWAARGVDGFRLDHTTSHQGAGVHHRVWAHVLEQVAVYARRRGLSPPVFLAEEFHDHVAMPGLVDVMTEGYLHELVGVAAPRRDGARLEAVVARTARFGARPLVLAGLENHDERRLVAGTGLDAWEGAALWAVGASLRATPQLLMGQEVGEAQQLTFARSQVLASRFVTDPAARREAEALTAAYRSLARARLDPRNRALRAPAIASLRAPGASGPAADVHAALRWSGDGSVVLVVHGLAPSPSVAHVAIGAATAAAAGLDLERSYRLIDVLVDDAAPPPCLAPGALATGVVLALPAPLPVRWLRVEPCPG